MIISALPDGKPDYKPIIQEALMFIQTDNDVTLPLSDDTINLITEEKEWWRESGHLEIDGTGKLQITNTGGTSAAEGGMGSNSDSEIEKGELQQPLSGKKGAQPNTDSDTGWDPVKENIEEATAKRNSGDKDE